MNIDYVFPQQTKWMQNQTSASKVTSDVWIQTCMNTPFGSGFRVSIVMHKKNSSNQSYSLKSKRMTDFKIGTYCILPIPAILQLQARATRQPTCTDTAFGCKPSFDLLYFTDRHMDSNHRNHFHGLVTILRQPQS